jgi:hypothetical protein
LLWFSPDFVRPAKIEKSSESFTRAVACFVVAMSGLGIGGLLIRSSRQSLSASNIPEPDRALLEPLISAANRPAIQAYIDLSSLRGATVVFTRLGVLGLPLVTILLTLIFAGLSLLPNNPHSEKYLDIARLTLGAFIGSFVQKQQSAGSTNRRVESVDARPRSDGNTSGKA